MRITALISLIILSATLCSGVLAAEYNLGPGDALSIKIINVDNLSSEVKVQPDGDITLPLVGAVTAAGKTAPKLAEELRTEYSDYLVKPSVSVTIKEFRQDTCIVLGQVTKPGQTAISDGMTIRGVIAAAGGATDKADMARISLARGASSALVDLLAASLGPDKSAVVQPGDIIMVPEVTVGVLVLGSVAKPGSYDWKDGMRVMDVLDAAGGPLEDADRASTLLTSQGGKTTPVNLADLISKGAVIQNVELRRGDVLYVPRQEMRYYVFGEVAKPGEYVIKGADKLVGALSAAGGTTANADLSGIGVVRLVDGKPEVVRADLNKFAKTADQSQNIGIKASDVVFVPEKKRKWSWQDVTAPLSIVGLALSLRR